jgi:hypothetical protein
MTGAKGNEPLVGSRMQQACSHRAEQAVELVRNQEDGTRGGPWQGHPEGSLGCWEWTHGWSFDSRGEVAKVTRGGPATDPREKGTLKRAPRQGGEPMNDLPRSDSASNSQADPEGRAGDGERSGGVSGRPTTDHALRRFTF